MIRCIFLLIILISIEIKASSQKNHSTIGSNNLRDFIFEDNGFSSDDTNLTDDSILDDLVLYSLSYYPPSQNISKILEESTNTHNEAVNLLKQDVLNNNSAITLNEELELKSNKIIEMLIQHDFDADNSLNENINNVAKDEVDNNYNLMDEDKINSNTDKGSENNLVHHTNNNPTKDEVDDNYNLMDEDKINNNTDKGFENNLAHHANNNPTKDEVDDNYNLMDEDKINNNTDKGSENNLAHHTNNNPTKDEVDDNYNLMDEDKINSNTDKGSENNLAHHTNNSLTSTKNSTVIGFVPRGVINNTDILISNIDNRLNSLTRSFEALAAGDEERSYEFYINPFIGKATQKETKKISRYHSTSRGIIIGHDAHLNDSLQLGTNFTRVETKFNFPKYKTTVRSNYYSLYGLYIPSNQNIFTNIIGIYGISDIINFNQIKNTHKAYTNVMQVMLGSNYKLFSTMHIKPMLGLKYSKIREESYLENNLSIANVKEQMIQGVLGLKLANPNTLKLVSVTPEIYAFAYNNIKSKIPSTQTNIIDTRILPIYIRKSPLSFSYGAKLSIRAESIEIGINYNGTKANKFMSHLGSINLKIID